MAISHEIQKYIGIPYKRENGPQKVTDRTTVFTEGLNCQLLTHEAVEILTGVRIPVDQLSKEMYENNKLFPHVDDQLQAGDIMLFGKEKEDNFKKLHVTVYTGEINEDGQPLLVHSNGIDRQVSIWPLSQFEKYKQYKVLYATKRYNPTPTIV